MSSAVVPRPWLSRHAGPALIGIGALHTLVVLIFAGPILAGLLSDGWVATLMDGDPRRTSVFWCLLFGLLVAIIGALIPADRAPLPRIVPLALLVLFLAGGLAMPPTGFWLGVVVAIALLRAP